MRMKGHRNRAPLGALMVAAAVLLTAASASAQTKISATYDTSGAIEVAAGDGPTGVAYDGTNIWVTSQFGNSVVKIAPTGVVLERRYACGGFRRAPEWDEAFGALNRGETG